MKISELKLRKIIQAQLKEFRLPEKEVSISADRNISAILDKALGGMHASGRKFPSWLSSSVNENKQIMDLNENELLTYTDQLITLQERGTLDIEKFSILHDGENKELPSPYLEIVKSILLFTGGNVASVRSPSKFKASRANNLDSGVGIYSIDYLPKKLDYQIAKNFLLKLAVAKNSKINFPIYRGITLNLKDVKSIKPGIKFNNWPLSSWTANKTIAVEFSGADAGWADDVRVLIKINNPQYGYDISSLSAYPVEKEVIFGKKIKIVKVTKSFEDDQDVQDDPADGEFDDYRDETGDFVKIVSLECEVIP